MKHLYVSPLLPRRIRGELPLKKKTMEKKRKIKTKHTVKIIARK